MNPNYSQPKNTHHSEQRAGTGRAAYLLNMGPMPPATQQDYAVALMNHTLDGGGQLHEEEFSSEDENIGPQLRVLTQPQPQVVMAPAPGTPLCSQITSLI